jgi:PAS domain S-box-containing protein
MARDSPHIPRLSDVLAALSTPGTAALVADVDAALWVVDAHGRTLGWSPGLEALAGSADPLPSFEPADRNALLEAVRAYEQGEIDADVGRSDGRVARLALKLRPLAGGDAATALVTVTDITKARATERLEAELEERQRVLLANVPVVLYQSDPVTFDGTYFSDGVERLTGYSAATLLGTPGLWLAQVHPDDVPTLSAATDVLLRDGHVAVEYRWRLADGRWRWFRDEGVILRDPEGRPTTIVGTWADITERHEVEGALRRSEANLRKAQELAEVGSWEFDTTTGELRWSDHVYHIVDRDPALGPPGFDEYMTMVHPDDRQCMRLMAHATIERGEVNDVEYRLLTPGGERLVRSIAEPESDASGRVVRVHGALMDITDTVEREETLRRSEAGLRKSQELAHIGSWQLAWPERILWWSDETYRIVGRDPALGPPAIEEYVGKYVHPEDREPIREALVRANATGGTYDLLYRLVGTFGVRHVRSLSTPRRDDPGHVIAMEGTLMDVTERVLKEQELQEARQRLELALLAGRMGMWDWDVTSDQITWDTGWTDMLGYGHDEVRREYAFWREHVHPDDLARVEAAIRHNLDGLSPGYEVEYRMQRKDGAWIWTHSRGRVTERDARGRPVRMTGVQFDITEQRRAAETAHKAEERARRAEHLASIGTLAAGLAHELNNPLGGILLAAGYAEQALDRRGADGIPTAREGLRDVIEDAKRGGRVVSDVLTFARAEPSERSPTPLPQLVERALSSVQAQAAGIGATVTADIPPDLPPLLVNAGEMHQVFVNLLRNALDSRDGQPVTVRVSAERSGPNVCVHVDDDGHGLSEHVRKHLFEPFFTTRRDQGGTGLGLSLSHGIVTTHGGSIEAAVSPLGGARFTVSLPIHGGAPNGEDPGRR